VQRCSNLGAQSNFTTIQSGVAGQPGLTTWIDAAAEGHESVFYRVGLQ
jgi:hypothetical protein